MTGLKNKYGVCLLFAVLLCGIGALRAQDSVRWQLISTCAVPAKSTWTSDHFGNLYAVNRDLIVKYDPAGKKMFDQSLKRYGQITAVDAKNPMKIMLFSEQQQVIFYLDNTLTKQDADLELEESDLKYVTLAESSFQPDKIWVYDQENSRVQLLASKAEQNIRIQNLSGLLGTKTVTRMMEREGHLFVYDPNMGLYWFDVYGTYLNRIPVPACQWIETDGKKVFVLIGDKLLIYDLDTNQQSEIALPQTGIERFEIHQNHVFLHGGDTIFHYDLQIF